MDAATASVLNAAGKGDQAAAAAFAARVLESRPVRAAVGDHLRESETAAAFKAGLARHALHYHIAVKAHADAHALSILSSLVDINDSADVLTPNRLNTEALAGVLSLAEHQLTVDDEVVMQDGPRRRAFKVDSVNENGTFDLRENEGAGVRRGVQRAEAIYATDIRVTSYMINKARNHTRARGPGQPVVVQKWMSERVNAEAFASMIEFTTSPAAVSYLSGRSNFTAKRTAPRADLFNTYEQQCKADGVRYVRRTFFYGHAFDERFTDDQAEDCTCSACATSGAMAFQQLRTILGSMPECEGAATDVDFVREQCAALAKQVDSVEQFMRSEFYAHLKQQDNCFAHCANLQLSSPQDARYFSPCTHAPQHEDKPNGTRTEACDTCNRRIEFPVGTFRSKCSGCKAQVSVDTACTGCGEPCIQANGNLSKHTLQCTSCGTVAHTDHEDCVGSGELGGAHELRATPAPGTPATAQCGTCMRQQDNRDHPEQCEPCNELFYVTEDIQALIEWVQQKASDEHVGVLAAQTVDMAASLLRYRGHLVRHFQVTQEKLRTLRELGPTEVFLTADWAALRHGTKHKVAQNAGYGQTGRIGIHPLVAMRRATSQDQLKDGTAPGDVFIVHRIVFVTDITDFNAIDTAAIIEQSLKAYAAVPGHAHIKTAILKTDQADDYAGATTPLILFSEDSFQRAGGCIRITRIIHSEPGEGKARDRGGGASMVVVVVAADVAVFVAAAVAAAAAAAAVTAAAVTTTHLHRPGSHDVASRANANIRISVTARPAQSTACSKVRGGKPGRRL